MAAQDNELNNLVTGLRQTAERLKNQTEAIADAIQRIDHAQRTIGSAEHTFGTFPQVSPQLRALRNRNTHRPQHEATRNPDGPNNPHGSLLTGVSTIGPRNGSNNSQHSGNQSTHTPRTNFSSSGTTLAQAQFRIDPSSSTDTNDSRCRCTRYDGSTIAEARFGMEPDWRSTSPSAPNGSVSSRNAPSSLGPSGSLSFRDHSDLMRALINWWSSFILENLNSENEVISGESGFRSTLNEIVIRWEEMSQSENSGSWS